MLKNKIKYLIVKIIIGVIVISTVFIWYKSIKSSVIQSDIVVEAVLELNNTEMNSYDEYLLNIKITKNKNCQVAVYPYIEGLGNMNFSKGDIEEYYLPGSIGSDGVTEPIAINELKNNNLIENLKDVSLTLGGFRFPYEAGHYKSKIYLDKLDTFIKVKNPVLVCVYTEKKYGKKLTWSKVVSITIK
jgi:hypothetical protein